MISISFLVENNSKVVVISNLKSPKLSTTQIYNLFSNFGNISKIIFTKSTASCLIEYENTHYATFAQQYLSNIPFIGANLIVL